jgi:outer membrane lipoprotein-sorting protein
MNKRWLVAVSVLAILSLLLGACQSRPSVEEIVAKMREVEESTEDAHGVLELSLHDVGTDQEMVVEAWEKRPNLTRVEVLESSMAEFEGSVLVSDGQQIWVYLPDDNKVLVEEIGPDEPSSPRYVINLMEKVIQHVVDTSDVKLVGEEQVAGEPTYKLEFTPREGDETLLPPGSTTTLWVDQERWVVLQAHFLGRPVGEAWVRVRSFEVNVGLAEDLFVFDIPEGAEVATSESRQPVPLTLDEARAEAGFLLIPAYVPEDLTLVRVFRVDDAYVLYYDQRADSSFTIVQGPRRPSEDIPLGETSEVTVRGQKAKLITDHVAGNNFLIWTEGDLTITIAGQIATDEMLAVAESLQ